MSKNTDLKHMRDCINRAPSKFVLGNTALQDYLGLNETEYKLLSVIKHRQHKLEGLNYSAEVFGWFVGKKKRTINRAFSKLVLKDLVQIKLGKYHRYFLTDRFYNAFAMWDKIDREVSLLCSNSLVCHFGNYDLG